MREEQEKRLRRILEAGDWTKEDLAWFMDAWERDEVGWMKGVLREAFDGSPGSDLSLEATDAEALLDRINRHMDVRPTRKVRARFVRMAAAASLVIGLFGGAYLWLSGEKPIVPTMSSGQQAETADIGPGTDRAILVLPGGRRLGLDGRSEGPIDVGGDGMDVRIQDDGIRYTADLGTPVYGDASVSHTLLTPRGGQYRLTLSDGTRVWLNSSSSIRFPAVFPGGERRVAITGEAYLEVAHDEARPFWVDVDGRGLVRVLGTRFNMNAYRDEPSLDITLLAGAVDVGRVSDADMVRIKPGQQARMIGSTGPVVSVIDDMQRLVAWKDGKFQFGEGIELSAVLRQLERWYDVEFRFDGEVRGRVGGSISRDVNLSQVLDLIGLTGVARFSREGRVVRVSNPG